MTPKKEQKHTDLMPNQYRKKPVVIEAFLWDGDTEQINHPEWAIEAVKIGTIHFEKFDKLVIQTIKGPMIVLLGDYIIKYVNDELYSCKPDVFMATYEPVNIRKADCYEELAWLDISTAPKDGSCLILACIAYEKLFWVSVGRFDKIGWFTYQGGMISSPTHYMLAPSPALARATNHQESGEVK